MSIVPHARDERRFDPDAVRPRTGPSPLGIGPDDRLLLFGGTPRVHKGVVEVLEALERLGDPRNRLAIFGTRELDELRHRIGTAGALGHRAAVPTFRRSRADRGRGRSVLRPAGSLPSGVPVPDAGQGQRCAGHGRAVPGRGSPAVAPVGRGRRGARVDDGSVPLHEQIAGTSSPTSRVPPRRPSRGRSHFLDHLSYEAVCATIAPPLRTAPERTGDAPQPRTGRTRRCASSCPAHIRWLGRAGSARRTCRGRRDGGSCSGEPPVAGGT